ncbi:MAG: hypothetical protein OXF02_08115 [Simkaniaceae bacterium]|nr:hypothetical protein [Simkaniaceae bacterium]
MLATHTTLPHRTGATGERPGTVAVPEIFMQSFEQKSLNGYTLREFATWRGRPVKPKIIALLLCCFASVLCPGCGPRSDEDEEPLSTVPVTNNPHVISSMGGGDVRAPVNGPLSY